MDMLDLVHIKTMMVRPGALVAHAPTTRWQFGALHAASILQLSTPPIMLKVKDHQISQALLTFKQRVDPKAISMALVRSALKIAKPRVGTKESLVTRRSALKTKVKVHPCLL